MVQFENVEFEEIAPIIVSFRKRNRIVFSNYFGVPPCVDLGMCVSNNTLLIRKKEYEAYRLFFMTSDLMDLKQMLSDCVGSFFVMNIPTREPIDDKIGLIKDCGFEFVAEYNRYFNKSIEKGYQKLETLSSSLTNDENHLLVCNAVEDDIIPIWKILDETFDLYTDHIPNEIELKEMVKQHHVFINKTCDGEIFGVHIFTPTNHLCYGNAWVDKKGYGVLLSKNMYRYALDHGIKTLNYWIRRGNNQVIKYHKMLGAVPDGLSDYSFIKK